MADAHEDKAKPNIKALKSFRLKGDVVAKDEVIRKSAFAKKGDWQNLCNMSPPKAEETDEKVGAPSAVKPKAAPKPKAADATAGGLPGAS